MQRTIEITLAVVVIGATLAFAGVQPITYSLTEIALFLAVLLVILKGDRETNTGLRLPIWPALFALLTLLQIVPLPSWLVTRLSPVRALDPKLVDLPPGQWVWATLSIYPHDTLLNLIKFLAYMSAFALAAYAFDSARRKSNLVLALMLLGGFEAAYGLVQYLTGWQKIFTYTKIDYRNDATGTYINHNHYAGFIELTLPLVIASVFYFFQLWSEARGRRAGPGTRTSAGIQSLLYLFLALMMVVAVLCSHSRGGILGAGISVMFVAVLALIVVLAKQRAGGGVWALGVMLFLTCVVCYGLWIGLDPVLSRFEIIHDPGYLEAEGRLGVWRSAVRLVHDYALTGTGLGTFGLGFRHYQTTGLNFFFDHAHNDYLEFASDTGLTGAALLFLPILYLLVKMVISLLKDPRRYRRAVTLGCVGSTLGLLIHSVMDFNLQIPANALIFAIILGIGYKAACLEPRGSEAAEARKLPYESMPVRAKRSVRGSSLTRPLVRPR